MYYRTLDMNQIDKARCENLITSEILNNNSTIEYPSNLGKDCDVDTKKELVLFLVR